MTPVSLTELPRIKRAAGDDYDYIRSQVASGALEFFKVGECYFVTGAEYTNDYSECVIVCAEGENLVEASKAVAQAAKQKGFDSVRFHTKRKALQRLIKHLDFNLAEYVYRLHF